ncbi:hypothetical protein NPX13_g9676 [Xylaria arbuscula]|uniref:Protein kinase domain-containing protein n=1 Tax=Xylaria arbuscula TaxID=114810 RepID=A0A9W8N6C0_9PEZI|nr:hypothetical protein NPX13_g9676 [Xylaria arbuscula]
MYIENLAMFKPGSILRGARATYKLQQALKANNTVFKAQVIDSPHLDSKWAVVKTSSSHLERALLHREFRNYQIPAIKQSPYIRRLHEGVGPFFHREYEHDEPPEQVNHDHYLVFEWMDQDLWNTPSAPFRGGDSQFPKIVSKSVLEALDIFRKVGGAHTGLEGDNPEVKVSDLGMLIKEGPKEQRFQSLPCRAPEVWRGLGVYHSSDIWSLGVTLTHWLYQRGLFGASEKVIEGHTEAWCMAVIQLLIGPMGEYNGVREIEDEWDIAASLTTMDMGPPIGKLMKYKNLQGELGRLTDPPVSSDIIDFIESLLVIDPSDRPTAEEALRHPFLASLEKGN